MLNPEDLTVESFATSEATMSIGTGGGFCCTGCDSGCGINPTGGGCESASGQIYCVDNNTIAAA
ncbi:hypothetical protein [Longimicrobium sp.]|uniref:hypothetical protein n=1 Tax=Longimicrobium sp. TaxID=2029185 RepID=UPI002C21222F|nr:hypothetical protein [Longimicrobium sp.]HSU15678.1 hypothetical protein [Longimicrobium sp.]